MMKLFALILALACSAQAQLITVGDWKDYKAECWKDSSVWGVSMTLGGVADSFYVEALHSWSWSYHATYDTTWTHRTPTFEGFMEWMERKPPHVFDIRDVQVGYSLDSTMQIITIPRKP